MIASSSLCRFSLSSSARGFVSDGWGVEVVTLVRRAVLSFVVAFLLGAAGCRTTPPPPAPPPPFAGPVPISDPARLDKLQAGIDLLRAKAEVAGEDPALAAQLARAAAALQQAKDDGRILEGAPNQAHPYTTRQDDPRGQVVLPPAQIGGVPGDLGFHLMFLDSLLHEGLHLAQGPLDPLAEAATDEERLGWKLRKLDREIEAYEAESRLKTQIANTLRAMSEGAAGPPWAAPWAGLDSGNLAGTANFAAELAIGARAIAGMLKDVRDGLVPFKRELGRGPGDIAGELDRIDVVRTHVLGDKQRRIWIVTGGPTGPGQNVVVVEPDGAVRRAPLDTGVAVPQGGLLFQGPGGDVHFLLCGLDGPRDIFDRDRPPLGVIRDYWGAGGAAGFDRDRTIMQGDTRLAFPASLARMEDGRVFLFDAAAWAAYSLSDPDRDGVPDGWRPAPILVVPEALRRRHPLDLLAEEDRLVVQPRIVVTPDDDHPWRIVFTDRDGDGVFETVAPPPAPATPGRPRGRRHGR